MSGEPRWATWSSSPIAVGATPSKPSVVSSTSPGPRVRRPSSPPSERTTWLRWPWWPGSASAGRVSRRTRSTARSWSSSSPSDGSALSLVGPGLRAPGHSGGAAGGGGGDVAGRVGGGELVGGRLVGPGDGDVLGRGAIGQATVVHGLEGVALELGVAPEDVGEGGDPGPAEGDVAPCPAGIGDNEAGDVVGRAGQDEEVGLPVAGHVGHRHGTGGEE